MEPGAFNDEEGNTNPQSSGPGLTAGHSLSNEHPAAVAGWLEAMTRQFCEILANKDHDNSSPESLEYRRHVAPDYLAYNDNIAVPLNYDDHMAAFSSWAQQSGHEFIPKSISAQVGRGKAVVYLQAVLRGLVPEANMAYFIELRWERRDGQWMLWQCQAMRTAQDGT